jgi:hypothetical protein
MRSHTDISKAAARLQSLEFEVSELAKTIACRMRDPNGRNFRNQFLCFLEQALRNTADQLVVISREVNQIASDLDRV